MFEIIKTKDDVASIKAILLGCNNKEEIESFMFFR